MAKSRTMIKTDTCTSDVFLDMSHSAQALYLQLNVSADSQGVVSNVRRVMRGGDFKEEHLNELLASGFVIELAASSVRLVVIAHWWEMNRIDKHNFYQSQHQTELVNQVCTIGEGRIYQLKSSLSDAHVLTGHEGKIPTIEQAIRQPVCNQSGSSLLPVLNKETNNKVEVETNNLKEIEKNKKKETEGAAAHVANCPICHGQASVSSELDGSTLFDCHKCGLFTIDANGEIVGAE